MSDVIDNPNALLEALCAGEQVAPLAPDVEVLCERALRTRSRVSLRAARVALALEWQECRDAGRKPTARLHTLKRQVGAAVSELLGLRRGRPR